MRSCGVVAVWMLGLVATAAGCKKNVETGSMEHASEAPELEDKTNKAFFATCTERAEMKAGNHYKVYDCGAQRASYYDSPGKMTFDEVTAPISAEARSLGYQVFPSDGSMHITTAPPETGSGSGSGCE
jgi:hypothetical protein